MTKVFHKLFRSISLSSGPSTRKEALQLYLKGIAMGIADLIPGVSGGTIAFIVGIYDQLLNAISSINQKTLKTLKSDGPFAALETIHIKFGVILLAGILTSMFSLARVMHYLITEQPIITWGFFFGLISASIPLMWRQVPTGSLRVKILGIFFGSVFAFLVVGMIPLETPSSPWFIYVCGVIGITAMILPGISGSFLLLMLGKYEMITAALKNPATSENFLTLVIFSCGSLTGLLTFSRLLKYLLNKYRIGTMSFLCGVLLGSLRKVWPWKEVLERKLIRGKFRILREQNVLPSDANSEVVLAITLCILGVALIYFLERGGKPKAIHSNQ